MEELYRRILELYSWLLDFYMIEYFIFDLWNKLPLSWRITFERIEPEDCACILSSSPPCKIVLPLAILCLRTIVNTLPPREAVSSRLNLTTICGTHIKVTDSFLSATSKGRLTVKLKTKKQHEIDRLVNFIKVLKSTHLGESFHFIVDIGAGMGHLSRILSVSLPDCSIIAVEKNDDLVKKSILLNEKLRRRCNSSDNLEHRCELVEAAFHGLDIPDLSSDQKALLIGLHPCGDLSSSILRLFGFGLPLSSRYGKLTFSRCALDLACHSNENYVQKLLTKSHSSYRKQCYRAVLECLIAHHKDEEIRRHRTSLVISSVNGNKDLTFEEYVKLALARYPCMIENYFYAGKIIE
ncbi:Ribosomal RNA adenine dimethylase domain-containing protein 1 [Parelaphostrongylus tenuis]|uniref:Ribosomal RNA adenine dimethylase domain-containing protein 1 n=1 Tax=Parelaphostrongylus tenuis TaxID=148309 RepID=A0AAD5MDI6_PARTN|nr:Ribosomal RNA adenine dimethylase domain-containing protein 1 [Parelaphostrongylus tenuis]